MAIEAEGRCQPATMTIFTCGSGQISSLPHPQPVLPAALKQVPSHVLEAYAAPSPPLPSIAQFLGLHFGCSSGCQATAKPRHALMCPQTVAVPGKPPSPSLAPWSTPAAAAAADTFTHGRHERHFLPAPLPSPRLGLEQIKKAARGFCHFKEDSIGIANAAL